MPAGPSPFSSPPPGGRRGTPGAPNSAPGAASQGPVRSALFAAFGAVEVQVRLLISPRGSHLTRGPRAVRRSSRSRTVFLARSRARRLSLAG